MGERNEHFDENDGMTPEEIVLPRVSIPEESLIELAEFIANAVSRGERMAFLIKKFMQAIYTKAGNDEEAASAIINYLSHRHKWSMEVLVEKKDVEEMFFSMFSHYDENIWAKFVGTQAMSDLYHEVYKLSREFIEIGLREIMSKESNKDYPEVSRRKHESVHQSFFDDLSEDEMMFIEFDDDDDDVF